MPYLPLRTRVFWKLQQTHADGVTHFLTRWGSRPFVLTDKPAVVIAPHQDDESLGCGGLIALKRERNVPVYLVFLTNGGSAPLPETGVAIEDLVALRKSEARVAAAILGVDPSCLFFLNRPDSALESLSDEDRNRMIGELGEIFRRHHIEEVFAPHRQDCHRDHEAAYQLTRRATLQAGGNITLFQYPIWMLWSAPVFFRLRRGDIAGAQRLSIASVQPKKRRAIAAHQSQCATLPKGFLKRFHRSHEIFFASSLGQPE